MPHQIEYNVAYIVDWEASSIDVLEKLLNATILGNNFNGLKIWSSTLSEGVHSLLHRFGFNSPEKMNRTDTFHPFVMVKPLMADRNEQNWSIAGRNLLEIWNWDLRAIYSDAF